MTLFLFLKQIVDMLYQHQILDYLMVAFAVMMVVYQFLLIRPSIHKVLTLSDAFVVILGVHVTMIFFRRVGDYGIYFKIMSAFLMYFMGRLYYDRIRESVGALVKAGYIVVYVNLIWRIIHFGFGFFHISNADGDLYYYDTDMAFAMILAMVFIVMYGHNTLFKYITAFMVCPIMVFSSDAGIQMVLMLAVYAIIALYILELLVENRKIANILLTIFILGLIAIVIIIYLPVFELADENVILTMFGSKFFDNDNMYGRYEIWNRMWKDFKASPFFFQGFGTSLSQGVNFGSFYMKLFHSLGIFGITVAMALMLSIVYYVVKISDRKTFYICVILAVLLLGTGVTVCSFDSTQMSWFPMMFAGMVVSSVQVAKNNEKQQV